MPLLSEVPGSNPPTFKATSIYTDNNGNVTIVTDGVTDTTTSIIFQISTKSAPLLPTAQYSVVNPVDPKNPTLYQFDVTATGAAIAPGGTISFPAQELTQQQFPNIGALGVFDAVTAASLYAGVLAQDMPGVFYPAMTVDYPAPEGYGTEFDGDYSASGALLGGTMYVEADNAFSYDEIAHEYGHYVAAAGLFSSIVPRANHDWRRT